MPASVARRRSPKRHAHPANIARKIASVSPRPPALPPPQAGMSKLRRSTGSRPASTSRDVGPLATDQMSIAATNSGTASATAGVASAEASRSPAADAASASGTLASAPTPARFRIPVTIAAASSTAARTFCARHAGSSDHTVAAMAISPMPSATRSGRSPSPRSGSAGATAK